MTQGTAKRRIKIAFIGGGSENWAPTLIRDIVFKKGMEQVEIDFSLLDQSVERAGAIKRLFDVRFRDWKVDRVRLAPTTDATEALTGADFVMIAISTGRLEAMQHDLAVPERYGIYHTVGDTAGPGGWSRALRNIPVFTAYAEQIKKLAPEAYVLNYTNPLAALTKVLANVLGNRKVVGLCHGLFECYDVLQAIFGLESEDEIQTRFGGLNHFFWILDLKVRGEDGYRLLREKMQGRSFAGLIKEIHRDAMGFSSDKWLASELFEQFGYLPYVGDRHTCEFFNCYMTNTTLMERFKLKRTTIEDREKGYQGAGMRLQRWSEGKKADWGWLNRQPSRETAADIIKAVTFNTGFKDVTNTVNTGQISNLPLGAVVETMGYVDGSGFYPLATGSMPEPLRLLLTPHAEVQLNTVAAGLSGNLEEALMALVADPICAHMTISDIKKMGKELLEANRQHLPQFFA